MTTRTTARAPLRRRNAVASELTHGQVEAETSERLLRAAREEFALHGFDGTDSNKIARRAGFAPQTFYRWYRDKTAIFIAAYGRWQAEESAQLARLIVEKASTKRLADAIVEHHRAHLLFRRSLRQLAAQEAVVRRARAESRLRLLLALARLLGRDARRVRSADAVRLLQVERLADAIAEGELRDMGLDEASARGSLSALLNELRRAS